MPQDLRELDTSASGLHLHARFIALVPRQLKHGSAALVLLVQRRELAPALRREGAVTAGLLEDGFFHGVVRQGGAAAAEPPHLLLSTTEEPARSAADCFLDFLAELLGGIDLAVEPASYAAAAITDRKWLADSVA